jgi:hypothetical protein
MTAWCILPLCFPITGAKHKCGRGGGEIIFHPLGHRIPFSVRLVGVLHMRPGSEERVAASRVWTLLSIFRPRLIIVVQWSGRSTDILKGRWRYESIATCNISIPLWFNSLDMIQYVTFNSSAGESVRIKFC